MPDAEDRDRLRRLALALRELANDFVFLGGGVTSLLITDLAAAPTRLSKDLDAVVRAARTEYIAIEQRLRQLGFTQRAEEPVICRWFRDDLILDVMPDDPATIGFSNRWYRGAFDHATSMLLDGVTVRVVAAPWFVATKLEAFAGRGAGDYLASRDIEDIVAVIDGRDELEQEIDDSSSELRDYIRTQLAALLKSGSFVTSVAGHLAGDSERAQIVLERMASMAGLA